MLKYYDRIFSLINRLTLTKPGQQMMLSYGGDKQIINAYHLKLEMLRRGVFVSTITSPIGREATEWMLDEEREIEHETPHSSSRSKVRKRSEVFVPESVDFVDCDIIDKFQGCVVLPYFEWNNDNYMLKRVEHIDRFGIFQSAKNHERKTFKHLAMLEQAFRASHAGQYIFAVVPENWRSTDMFFNKWMMYNISKVFDIELPEDDYVEAYNYELEEQEKTFSGKIFNVKTRVDYKVKRMAYVRKPIGNKMKLVCWFKFYSSVQGPGSLPIPDSSVSAKSLEWAEMSYTPFEVKLEENKEDEVVEAFRKTEWFKLSVFQRSKKSEMSNNIFGINEFSPRGFSQLRKTTFVDISDKATQKILTIEDDEDISRSANKVLIKITRSRVSVEGYNRTTVSLVKRMMESEGFTEDKNTGTKSTVSIRLKRNFEEIKDWLVNLIHDYGMIPCMTKSSIELQEKSKKKLSKQLTPISRFEMERTLNKSSGKFSTGEIKEWREVNKDISIKVVHESDYDMWMKRALKMKIDKFTFDFQLNDIVTSCMKKCPVNGSDMGLGKTREVLFTMLLRGTKTNLIVCPKKLIGTWQDEIEGTINPFFKLARKHWNGTPLRTTSPNIIEWAEDCRRENLKLFNIIGYDTLKMIPKDGKFYKCPKCGFVIYKFFNDGEIVRCPGDPYFYNDIPSENKSCTREYMMYRESMNKRDSDGNLIYRKYKVHLVTGKKVHWDESHPSREGIPEFDCEIVDTRKDNPYLNHLNEVPLPPEMHEQTNMHDKVNTYLKGFKTECIDGVDTQVPVYGKRKRKFHVKWTFAELIRNTFSSIAADEVMYVFNPSSKRSMAMYHTNSKHKIPCTGTPLRGNPQNTLGWLNWAQPKNLFPEYRKENPVGLKTFLGRFKTEVVSGTTDSEGNVIASKRRQVPKIRNAALFLNELSPFMIRRKRVEPEVARDIPPIKVSMYDDKIKMDAKHRSYYLKWIEWFIEWWKEMKEEEEGQSVGEGNILAKLQYLIGASTTPHGMLARLKKKNHKDQSWRKFIDDYKGPPTGKMFKAFELIAKSIKAKDKIIIFANRAATLDLGKKICDKNNIESVIVDGRIPLDPKKGETRGLRHRIVQDFRFGNIPVMWAGIKALAEGMNIPEANRVVIYDTTWEHQDAEQAIGRVVRPQQTKDVFVNFLMHEGTIEEFVVAWCYLKHRSHSEGIDGVSFDDFSADMVPDISAYAEAIVDGTQDVVEKKMWSMVDQLKDEWERSLQDMEDEGDIDDEEYDGE